MRAHQAVHQAKRQTFTLSKNHLLLLILLMLFIPLLLDVPLPLPASGLSLAVADGGGNSTQPKITELEPECVQRGATLQVQVKNFNTTALTVAVGGVSTPVLSRTNNSNGTTRNWS